MECLAVHQSGEKAGCVVRRTDVNMTYEDSDALKAGVRAGVTCWISLAGYKTPRSYSIMHGFGASAAADHLLLLS